MKITAFNGSPRGREGNTHIMVEAFLKGASASGAEVENILLSEKAINSCLGCFGCWLKTPGECVMDDDMDVLLDQLSDCDVVIFATPLYVDNVSGIMKNFMDRMLPLAQPHIEKDEKGESRHPERRGSSPKIIVMSNCGFPEQSQFQVLKLLFKRIARNCHSTVIAEIYKGEGEILRNPDPKLKPRIDAYKKLLEKAGGEIAKDLKLSGETIAELEKPLIPYKVYIRGTNDYMDRMTGNR